MKIKKGDILKERVTGNYYLVGEFFHEHSRLSPSTCEIFPYENGSFLTWQKSIKHMGLISDNFIKCPNKIITEHGLLDRHEYKALKNGLALARQIFTKEIE